MSLKTLPTTLLIVILLLSTAAAPAQARHQDPDGITALITFDGSIGDLVLVPDENGDFHATITIFQKIAGAWEQIAFRGTLRVFEDTAPLEVTDRVSIPFTSDADAPVTVPFSGDGFTGGSLDIFVTFSALGGDPVPTSHHHLAKNAALGLGEYDLADGFDHHSTRVFVL